MTTVVHCLREPFDVLVARPSRWGNPYRLRATTGRDRVIAQFGKCLLDDPDMLRDLSVLAGLRLGCYCAPQRCHGHVLAALADRRVTPDELSDWADWIIAGRTENSLRWDAAFLRGIDREIFLEG